MVLFFNMANAKRDGNRVATLIGVSSSTTGSFTQDSTPVPVRVDPTTKRLYVDANVSSATITDIEDGTGDSVMDAANDALKVTIVADDVGIGGGTANAVSTNNSTATPLGIDAVYTGTSEDVSAYATILISVLADQDSATGGLSIQFSTDDSNWDFVQTHSIEANTAHTVLIPIQAQYFRIVYTNGGTGQSSFEIQTILQGKAPSPHLESLDGDVQDEHIVQTTRSVLSGKDYATSLYQNISSFAMSSGANAIVTLLGDVAGTPAEMLATQADNLTNASNGLITTSLGYVFDGSTWDRQRGDATNGMLVNLGSNNDVTVTGSVTANAGTNLNTSSLLTTSAHDEAFGTAGSATAQVRSIQGIASMTPVQVSQATHDNLNLNANLQAGDSDVSTSNPVPTEGVAYTPYTSIDLDETEVQVIGTACTVNAFYFWNATAAPLWVQIFDALAASIAPGSDAPDLNFPIPANADSDVAGVVTMVGPYTFSTALSIAVTTGSGTDSGAPGDNEAGVFLGYRT